MQSAPHSLPSYEIDSYYAHSAHPRKTAPSLAGSGKVEVVVVGGGFVGLSTALALAEKKYRVALLEAKCIGWGASGRSGGQAILDYSCGLPKLQKLLGAADVRRLFDFSLEALALLRRRIKRYQIRCDFIAGQATLAQKPRQDRALQAAQAQYAAYGHKTQLWSREKTRSLVDSPLYTSGLYDETGGHLHPLNYALGLAAAAEELGVTIYENSPLSSFTHSSSGVEVKTKSGSLKTDFLIFALGPYVSYCDRPLVRALRSVNRRMMPVGTYIAATAPLGKKRALSLIKNNAALCDNNFVLDYYRLSADWRLLFGGGVSYSTISPFNIKRSLYSRMVRVFPQLSGTKLEFGWGGYVDLTANRAPHFGRLSSKVFFMQGFSGHGVAFANIAGEVAAEAISGTAERFDVYSKIKHLPFPGGRLLRTPLLVLGMLYFRLRDLF